MTVMFVIMTRVSFQNRDVDNLESRSLSFVPILNEDVQSMDA